ncbi:MAG: AAA family ATPase [Desulfobulbaceae bacterium]|nr:AAA family ATPase [Desulfobulbaceae bacterium]
MSDDNLPNLPKQDELEKEIGDYLSRKYGGQVKIISAGLLPSPDVKKGGKRKAAQDSKYDFQFDLKPEDLAAYLDEYIVRQDEAKAILATKICTHFNRIRHDLHKSRNRQTGRIKSNVLLVGPTGVGKTYLIKLIANHIGVPFIKGDATKFSETGYVGGDVDDLVRDLVREADGNIERAQYGIIYVDEIDKIASSPNRIGADVSRTGVQRAFLKPMEETEVEMKVPHDPISQLEAMEHFRATGKREKKVVNTKNILFIMSGAFAGLEKTIKKRMQQQSIGFEQKVTSKKDEGRFYKQVKSHDLINYGFESEFVGRLPVIAVLDELRENDFFEILMNPNSPVVVAKKQDFAAYGIKLQFEEEAFRLIAAKAVLERTGARGLVSIMESVLLYFEKTLPSTDVRYFVVSPEVVEDPLSQLKELLSGERIQSFHRSRYNELEAEEYERFVRFIQEKQGDFLEKHNVAPTTRRFGMIAKQCQRDIVDPREACEEFISLVQHIRDCAELVSAECDLDISFDDQAIDLIITLEPWNGTAIVSRCEKIFNALDYGLKLIAQNNSVKELVITEEGVENPDFFINDVVSDIFHL